MPGITAFGASVPWQYLDRKRIFSAMGWFSPATFGVARGHKAVANHDEDSLTLAVAAARDCLAGRDAVSLDALVLASTTLPLMGCGLAPDGFVLWSQPVTAMAMTMRREQKIRIANLTIVENITYFAI